MIVDKDNPDVEPAALFEGVPPALRKVFGKGSFCCCWTWQLREKADGARWDKVPKQAVAGDRNASSSDHNTWQEMDTAVMRARQAGWGFAVMIAGRKDFACIDLDNCRTEDGTLEPWAADIYDRAGSYGEVSPSGRGIKIYGTMRPGGAKHGPRSLKKGGDAVVELFHDENRYLTVTGVQHGPHTELADITDLYNEIHAAAEVQKAEKAEAKREERRQERPKHSERATGGLGGDYFRNVREAALKDLRAWVPDLFPAAAYQPGTGAWRVKQSDLGTSYEEDLSIHPSGIQNFGPEETCTAIDLVMQFGGAPSALAAADWLCERLGIDPYSIGKKGREERTRAEDDPSGWNYKYNKEGNLLPTVSNVTKTILESPEWRNVFRYNELTQRSELGRPIPRPDGKSANNFEPRPVVDADILEAQRVLQNGAYPRLAKATAADAVEIVAQHHRYNPLQDYLGGLTWDGRSRIGSWLADYCNADLKQHDPAYISAVGRAWIISAVARAMQPGCKVDTALVMVGAQGVGKSSAAAILAGEWFSDSLPPVDTKDAADHLRGRWIVELPEMAVADRATVEAFKAFLSKTHEHFRPAYGIKEISFPRSCVFFGSTNLLEGFLKDITGNRRFWPVVVGKVDLAALKRDRDQLWAEAITAYRAGEAWHLAHEMAPIAAEEAAKFTVRDEREVTLENALRAKSETTVMECCCLLDLKSDTSNQRQVANMLRAIGWERQRTNRKRTWIRLGDA